MELKIHRDALPVDFLIGRRIIDQAG